MNSYSEIVAANKASTDVKKVTLIPEGMVDIEGAGEVSMTKEGGEKIVADFVKRGNRMVIDYEHQTLGGKYASPDGKAPAAGWITELEYQEGVGLIASIEWTEVAAKHIKAREYLYYSPVYLVDSDTRSVEGIRTVALTNAPRTNQLETLAASKRHMEKEVTPMADTKSYARLIAAVKQVKDGKPDLVELICMDEGMSGGSIMDLMGALIKSGVDVPEGADEATIVSLATQFIKSNVSTEDTADAEDAGGEDEEAASQKGAETVAASSKVLEALGAKNDDEGVIIAKRIIKQESEYKQLSQEVASLKAESLKKEIAAKMDEYEKANKINPNDEEQVAASQKFAERDFAAWVEFMDAQPAIVPAGSMAIGTTRVEHGKSREAIIASAKKEWESTPEINKTTKLRSYINCVLMEKNKERLTDNDKVSA